MDGEAVVDGTLLGFVDVIGIGVLNPTRRSTPRRIAVG